jgi:hypothetical protein
MSDELARLRAENDAMREALEQASGLIHRGWVSEGLSVLEAALSTPPTGEPEACPVCGGDGTTDGNSDDPVACSACDGSGETRQRSIPPAKEQAKSPAIAPDELTPCQRAECCVAGLSDWNAHREFILQNIEQEIREAIAQAEQAIREDQRRVDAEIARAYRREWCCSAESDADMDRAITEIAAAIERGEVER